jgi:predicted dehydrogenase
MTRTLGWGVIATGRIARTFATALKATTSGQLVAVASRALDRAQTFAAEFGATRAYGDYAALLRDPEVDAVYVATPHTSHVEWTIQALCAKKRVLCEKPLGMNREEVTAACQAARQHGVLLMEAFMYRSHPQTARLVELLRSGVIGEVRTIEASFGFAAPFDPRSRLYDPALGGGAILDVGCYPMSFARLIAAVALGVSSVEPEVVTGAGVRNGQTGVDELASATLRFSGGIIAQLLTSISTELENVARVRGTHGWLELPLPYAPARHGGESEILLGRRGSAAAPERIVVAAPLPLATYEIEQMAREKPDGEASFPAMTLSDSLGNAGALDRWLAAF